MRTVNTTFEVEEEGVTYIESWLQNYTKLINYKVIPDTNELYLNDPIFKKLVHNVKVSTKLRDEYINKVNV